MFITCRFRWVFPVIDAKFVAKESVNAVLRNQTLITVPKNALVFYGLGKYAQPIDLIVSSLNSQLLLLLLQDCSHESKVCDAVVFWIYSRTSQLKTDYSLVCKISLTYFSSIGRKFTLFLAIIRDKYLLKSIRQ